MSMTLEDFSGIARCIVFSSSYEKFREILHKDKLVVIHGEITVNERGGEKSSEVRLFEAKELDGSFDLVPDEIPMGGSIIVKIGRATKGDMIKMEALLRDHPGDHEVYVQIEPRNDHALLPVQLLCRPNPILEKEIDRLFGSNSFQIAQNLEFGNPF